MNMVDMILKKRGGETLTTDEITDFVKGYVAGDVPDYQAAAFLMAIWFKGLDARETTDLTLEMMKSGDLIDLSRIEGVKVDKHSTGGVADTTTLVAAPLVAACGGKVAKMSGRGLGHTGGTLDKLESIPGFSVSQSMERFEAIVREHGLSVIGQTANLVPADKKLYALRDVTGTVDNISLIAGSIMSKKLASGADAIVLDVKTGSGAFMKARKDSVALARTMVDIGKLAGRKVSALVTDMSQPLGLAVGNALEVVEAVEILRGEHADGDLARVSLALAARMLVESDLAVDAAAATEKLKAAVADGSGLAALRGMIEAQGGDPRVCDDLSLLPTASKRVEAKALRAGTVTSMRCDEIGMSALLLGAGRRTKEDAIDPAVGIWMRKRLGDRVETGETLASFHVNDDSRLEEAMARFLAAVKIDAGSAKAPELILETVE
jgi:pyrimidine-nucleoside phosphorylase